MASWVKIRFNGHMPLFFSFFCFYTMDTFMFKHHSFITFHNIPWVAEPRLELRPALQQASALPSEPCCTPSSEPRYTLAKPRCSLTMPCCIIDMLTKSGKTVVLSFTLVTPMRYVLPNVTHNLVLHRIHYRHLNFK